MYENFLKEFREKAKEIEDMPDRVQDILDFFNVDISSNFPIVEIIKKLGFEVCQSDLDPDGLLAYIAINSIFKDIYGTDKIICINSNNIIGLNNFVLAHELAHYLFDFYCE